MDRAAVPATSFPELAIPGRTGVADLGHVHPGSATATRAGLAHIQEADAAQQAQQEKQEQPHHEVEASAQAVDAATGRHVLANRFLSQFVGGLMLNSMGPWRPLSTQVTKRPTPPRTRAIYILADIRPVLLDSPTAETWLEEVTANLAEVYVTDPAVELSGATRGSMQPWLALFAEHLPAWRAVLRRWVSRQVKIENNHEEPPADLLDAASGPERAEHCYECGLKFTSRRALHRFAQVCEVPRHVVACIFGWTKPRLVFGHTSRCARCDGTLCMQFLDQSEAGQAFSGRHSFCGEVGGVDKRKQGLVKRTGRPQCHGDSAVCVGEQVGQVVS